MSEVGQATAQAQLGGAPDFVHPQGHAAPREACWTSSADPSAPDMPMGFRIASEEPQHPRFVGKSLPQSYPYRAPKVGVLRRQAQTISRTA
jgi:hypothetical protein